MNSPATLFLEVDQSHVITFLVIIYHIDDLAIKNIWSVDSILKVCMSVVIDLLRVNKIGNILLQRQYVCFIG